MIMMIFSESLDALCEAKLMKGDDVPNGWPLGLGNMNSRIRVADTSEAAAAAAQTNASGNLRCLSFSSFSSSNFDTESTASFFPDKSVSLGWLIGIRPAANKGSFFSEHRRKMPDEERSDPMLRKAHRNSHGLCVPLLHHVVGKMSRSVSCSR